LFGKQKVSHNLAKIKLYDPQARNSFGNRSFEKPITTEREREREQNYMPEPFGDGYCFDPC